MLEIYNLKIQQNNFKLDIKTLEVAKNDFILLIGLNAVGKTTFLKAISKLIPYTGSIKIDDTLINKISYKDLSKKIVYVNNDINYSDITVFDYLKYGRLPYSNFFYANTKNDNKIIFNYIKEFKIENLITREINTLSSGEKQRTSICKAFIQNTEYILLDEPTANMDIKYKKLITDYIINNYNKTKKTFIIASHDPELYISKLENLKILLLGSGQIIDFFTYEKTKFDNYIKNYFYNQ